MALADVLEHTGHLAGRLAESSTGDGDDEVVPSGHRIRAMGTSSGIEVVPRGHRIVPSPRDRFHAPGAFLLSAIDEATSALPPRRLYELVKARHAMTALRQGNPLPAQSMLDYYQALDQVQRQHPIASGFGRFAGMLPLMGVLGQGARIAAEGIPALQSLAEGGRTARFLAHGVPTSGAFGAYEALTGRPEAIPLGAMQGLLFGGVGGAMTPRTMPPSPSGGTPVEPPPSPRVEEAIPIGPVTPAEASQSVREAYATFPRPAEALPPTPQVLSGMVQPEAIDYPVERFAERVVPASPPATPLPTRRLPSLAPAPPVAGDEAILYGDRVKVVSVDAATGIAEVLLPNTEQVPVHVHELQPAPTRPAPTVAPVPADVQTQGRASQQARVLQEAIRLTPEQYQTVEHLREDIGRAQAGRRHQTSAGDWIGISSTFPEYFQNKGYTKQETLAMLDQVLQGPRLTARQRQIFQDLLAGKTAELKAEEASYGGLVEEAAPPPYASSSRRSAIEPPFVSHQLRPSPPLSRRALATTHPGLEVRPTDVNATTGEVEIPATRLLGASEGRDPSITLSPITRQEADGLEGTIIQIGPSLFSTQSLRIIPPGVDPDLATASGKTFWFRYNRRPLKALHVPVPEGDFFKWLVTRLRTS